MALEELPWLLDYSVTMYIFSDTAQMDICPGPWELMKILIISRIFPLLSI